MFQQHYFKSNFLQKCDESILQSTGPFTIFGLCFVGPITHYFYNILEVIMKGNTYKKVLFERLVFAPTFVAFTLYVLERLKVSAEYIVDCCLYFGGALTIQDFFQIFHVWQYGQYVCKLGSHFKNL